MKALLYKEFTLALHPASVMFLSFSAMLMIPGYPYEVLWFYTCLGIFFICLTGREMHDLFYTVSQPVCKADAVTARMALAVTLQLAQTALAVPFAVLRTRLMDVGNPAGMEANTALFGIALTLLGLFNLVFFTAYYKTPDKVGLAFGKGCAAFTAGLLVSETCVFALPFARDVLDTPDPQNLPAKLAVLGAGAAVYAGSTLLAWKKAQQSFARLDL